MTSSAPTTPPLSRKEQLLLWKANKQKKKQEEKENQEMSQSPILSQKPKTATSRKYAKARVKLVKSRVFSARPLNSDPKKLEIKRRFPSKEKSHKSIKKIDALTVKEMMQREIEMMKQNNITLQNHLAANIQRIKNLEAFTQKIDSLGERTSSTSSEDENDQKPSPREVQISNLQQKMKSIEKKSNLLKRHSASSIRIEVRFPDLLKKLI